MSQAFPNNSKLFIYQVKKTKKFRPAERYSIRSELSGIEDVAKLI